MQPSKQCYDLIKSFEGLYLHAYPDPGTHGAPFTIGYGTTRIDGKPVDPNLTITKEQAEQYLEFEVNEKAKAVDSLLEIPVTQGQYDALVSFAYNCGVGNLKSSTLLRLVNSGDIANAADQFLRWNRAAGRVLPGLTRRRQAERELFLS